MVLPNVLSKVQPFTATLLAVYEVGDPTVCAVECARESVDGCVGDPGDVLREQLEPQVWTCLDPVHQLYLRYLGYLLSRKSLLL